MLFIFRYKFISGSPHFADVNPKIQKKKKRMSRMSRGVVTLNIVTVHQFQIILTPHSDSASARLLGVTQSISTFIVFVTSLQMCWEEGADGSPDKW